MPIFEKNFALDLGTSTTLLFEQGKGIVAREPSVALLEKPSGKMLGMGQEAKNVINRTPANKVVVRPVNAGVICDYELCAMMLKDMMSRVTTTSIVKPCVLACVPGCITGVEERAIIDAAIEAGARKVYLIESAVATALGAGIDISKGDGHLIIDIGGGTTEVAIVSNGGVVTCESIKIAGQSFDESVIRYVRNTYNLQIGSTTAEDVKRTIGGVRPRPTIEEVVINGRDATSNRPRELSLNSNELHNIFAGPVNAITSAVVSVLERAPVELVGDLKRNPIIMSGGGSQLYGINRRIEELTGMDTIVVEDPISCAAYGAGKLLNKLEVLPEGMMNFSRRRLLQY